jgi:hypothetical protein
MAISLSRYVNITSAVGSGTTVPTRLLIGRMFTGNSLLPPDTFIQFTNAADVGTYFGTTSEEYYRALFYFAWISKNLTSAPAVQFARWCNAAVAPQIIPIPGLVQSLSNWTPVTAGSFGLTIGGVSNTLSSLDFSAAGSLNDVATIIEDAINAIYVTQLSGTLASSITVTGISSTSGLSVGMVVTGSGIQPGTTIASIVSGTSITLSLAATTSGASTLSFSLASNAQWVDATVTYTNRGFVFVGGATGAAAISVQAGSAGTDISSNLYLGWLPASTYTNNIFSEATYAANAIWSNGQVAESITTILTNSSAASNNFGSFLFLNNLSLNNSQIVEAATWNAAAAQNNTYLYTVPVVAANVSTLAGLLASFAGVTLTLSQTAITQPGTVTNSANTMSGLMNATSALQVGMPISGTYIPSGTVIMSIVNDNNILMSQTATGSGTESITFDTVQFPEQAPMMIEAATNYLGINTVQNYMFQDFDPYLTPLVTLDSVANSYDALSVNYYGQTQTAGAQFNFYQRGLMQGPSSAPLDQNTYVNEIWLKDAIGAALLQLMLNLNQLPANTQGQSLSLITIQGVINQALLNGVISVGKTLTTAQQTYITSISNDDNAWYQVQNAGYWVNCIIQPIPDITPTQYEAAYTLIYSKDDVIRLVTGSDILI